MTDDHPREPIVAAAKNQACDHIVTSSRGRRRTVPLLLGSKTPKVLTRSDIPVPVGR
jgi:nucleotide-binding universal stress UspA family protein